MEQLSDENDENDHKIPKSAPIFFQIVFCLNLHKIYCFSNFGISKSNMARYMSKSVPILCWSKSSITSSFLVQNGPFFRSRLKKHFYLTLYHRNLSYMLPCWPKLEKLKLIILLQNRLLRLQELLIWSFTIFYIWYINFVKVAWIFQK